MSTVKGEIDLVLIFTVQTTVKVISGGTQVIKSEIKLGIAVNVIRYFIIGKKKSAKEIKLSELRVQKI